MVMHPEFWNNKKVFLTGHTGFKGSWLSLLLNQLGAEVFGYSLSPPTNPNIYEQANISNDISSVTEDVRNLEKLKNSLSDFNPDIVLHLAAQSLVRESYQYPVTTFDTNIMGTVNILEAVRNSKSVKAFVNITSDKCYKNKEQDAGYVESDELGGHDPYSNSKACAELVTSSYQASYFDSMEHINVASARAGNVIGGGDWATDRLIPDLIRSFINNEKTIIRNPDAIRPWQHVLEPLSGYLLLAERLFDDASFSGSWNFGPNIEDAKPVSWIADELTQQWGNNASWTTDEQEHPKETHTLHLNSSKSREVLGWSPKLPLDQALEWTLDWYQSYVNNDSIRAITDTQIKNYLKKE
jgi:CDP-glucose 4,6-dehydratase